LVVDAVADGGSDLGLWSGGVFFALPPASDPSAP